MLRLSTSFCYNRSVPPEQPYHHKDLKQTLLDAAVALIAEVGPQAFTLREVARRAGVSHNAPYRHFVDRDDLLAAVAAQGFDRLTHSMTRAMKAGPTAAERLRLAGRGYVQFALRWPEHIRVMFDGPRTEEPRPDYAAAGHRAFQTLLEAIIAVQSEGGLPKGDPQIYAIASWSAMHGLAKLAIGGQLPFRARHTLEVADYLTAALARGMAHPASDVPRRG
jgi:AcrR family transcriptional regulator